MKESLIKVRNWISDNSLVITLIFEVFLVAVYLLFKDTEVLSGAAAYLKYVIQTLFATIVFQVLIRTNQVKSIFIGDIKKAASEISFMTGVELTRVEGSKLNALVDESIAKYFLPASIVKIDAVKTGFIKSIHRVTKDSVVCNSLSYRAAYRLLDGEACSYQVKEEVEEVLYKDKTYVYQRKIYFATNAGDIFDPEQDLMVSVCSDPENNPHHYVNETSNLRHCSDVVNGAFCVSEYELSLDYKVERLKLRINDTSTVYFPQGVFIRLSFALITFNFIYIVEGLHGYKIADSALFCDGIEDVVLANGTLTVRSKPGSVFFPDQGFYIQLSKI